jgi:uncharacterized NAD(P)/FAD-binding protein YdhS
MKVGIIGGGFSGTLTAIQLVYQAIQSLEIIIFTATRESLSKGIAYNTYSNKQLLNVITEKMSAFSDEPTHFLDWVMTKDEYTDRDRNLIASSFLPRQLYGEYLSEIWEETKKIAARKGIHLTTIESIVTDLKLTSSSIVLTTEKQSTILVNQCVIATGNQLPRNPPIVNMEFYSNSTKYYQNPWKIDSVKNITSSLPVLVIGNGLTMADTVLGIQEQGFKGEIYSISPNGFNILPHRHSCLKYTKLTEELSNEISLYELVKLVNKHRKIAHLYGITAEPVIDSIRPFTQTIWQNSSQSDKQKFMSRLRHMWGVARHRIPMHIHDKIQQLRFENKLFILSGKIINFEETNNSVTVTYYNKKSRTTQSLEVSRVINCTGPESDIQKLSKGFLLQCIADGIFVQDNLKLGINTDPLTFQVNKPDGTLYSNLYTLGTNLKGILWESTAVNEIRLQTKKIATTILNHPSDVMID